MHKVFLKNFNKVDTYLHPNFNMLRRVLEAYSPYLHSKGQPIATAAPALYNSSYDTLISSLDHLADLAA